MLSVIIIFIYKEQCFFVIQESWTYKKSYNFIDLFFILLFDFKLIYLFIVSTKRNDDLAQFVFSLCHDFFPIDVALCDNSSEYLSFRPSTNLRTLLRFVNSVRRNNVGRWDSQKIPGLTVICHTWRKKKKKKRR